MHGDSAWPHTVGMLPPDRAAPSSQTRVRADGEERRTQAERSEATTEQLIRAARDLFATKGFAATSIEDIVQAAHVTRGAMYHHFQSKEDLFEAVFEREEKALARRIHEAALKKRAAWAQLKAGCDEFLQACTEQAIQQIVLIDAPAVLGSRRLEEIQRPHSVNMLTSSIEKAIEQGALRKRPALPLAQLIYGALCQAAMVSARSEDDAPSMKQMRRELQELLDALEEPH